MTWKTEVPVDVFRYIQKRKHNRISEEIDTDLGRKEKLEGFRPVQEG